MQRPFRSRPRWPSVAIALAVTLMAVPSQRADARTPGRTSQQEPQKQPEPPKTPEQPPAPGKPDPTKVDPTKVELAPVSVTAAPEPEETTEGTGSYTTRATSAATRMPLSLRETPQSVSVIGRQQIEDQNLRTLDDVLRQMPGIVVQRRDERVSYFSRGFTLNQMVDGVPTLAYASVAAEASMNNMAVYDRVEVVRGPAGLLNGAGQPGGSINLVRKRPTADFSMNASAGFGSWSRNLETIDLGGPLTSEGSIRARFVSFHTSGDSFIERKDRRDGALYGIVEADITSHTMVAAGVEHQQTRIDGANFGTIPALYNNGTPTNLPRSFSSSTPWSSWDMNTTRVFVNVEHRLESGWRVKADVAYLDNGRKRFSGDIWTSPANVNPVTGMGTISLADNPADSTNKSFDLYATGPFQLFGRSHQVVAGVNLVRYSSETRTNVAINTGTMIDNRPVNIFDLASFPKPDFQYPRFYFGSDTAETAAYASTRLKPTKALSVLVGGRVSWYTNKPWSRRWFSGGDGSVLPGATIDESGVFTPYVGLVYDLTRQLSAYASYTDIFQPNTVNDRTGTVLEPQRGGNIEVGLKGEHFGGALNTSLSVFRLQQDNVPVAVGLQPDGSVAYTAVRGTRTRGFEATASGEIWRGWQIMGGYTYGTPRRNDGSLLTPTLPTRQFRLATTYRLPDRWSKLMVGGNVSYRGSIYLDDSSRLGRVTQGAVTLIGLVARYDITDRFSVSFNSENTTDRGYVDFDSVSGYVWGAPRNAWLQASYRF